MTREWLQKPENWALLEAKRDGKEIELYSEACKRWIAHDPFCALDPQVQYRIKPAEPHYRPFEATEVPLREEVWHRKKKMGATIVGVCFDDSTTYVKLKDKESEVWISAEFLLRDWRNFYTDEPCGKPL